MKKIARTLDSRFDNLPDYPFTPHYTEVEGLRMHYLDEGPADAPPVLLLHGEPTWSYLYRKMIPIIQQAGYRVLAPDLIGFGKSDKPVEQRNYTYANHVRWLAFWLEQLGLRDITLVCQDWGGLLGLRLVTQYEDRFARIVAANTALPTGSGRPSLPFMLWRWFSKLSPVFPIGRIIQAGSRTKLSAMVRDAYNAPFPDDSFKAGARQFPVLVPLKASDAGAAENLKAWQVLESWQKPFLTAFSDGDPLTRGYDRVFQRRIPGAQTQAHTTITGAGHFLQEDQGEAFAAVVINFMQMHQL